MTELHIGQKVERTDLTGDTVVREIHSEQELENYVDMQERGFVFKVLTDGA